MYKRQDLIRETIAMRPDNGISSIKVTEAGKSERDGIQFRKITIARSEGPPLPAIILIPKSFSETTYLYVHGDGKAAALAEDGGALALAKKGHRVMAIDMRGTGELESPENYKGWEPYFGRDWQDYFAAYLVGNSFVGMRTEDVISAGFVLGDLIGENPIHVIGVGEAAPAVLHAAVFEPERFASVELIDDLDSWTSLLGERVTNNQLINAVHGALRVYDLPDLRAILADLGKLK